MFKISISECVIIGIITVISGLIIQYIIKNFAEDDIKINNIFVKNKKNIIFWISLFIIGITIHIIITSLDLNSWDCNKVCTNGLCKIVCVIPFNGMTELLLTK